MQSLPFIRAKIDNEKANKSGSDIEKQNEGNYQNDKFNFETSNELALTMGPTSKENKERLKNRFASKKNRQTSEMKNMKKLASNSNFRGSP